MAVVVSLVRGRDPLFEVLGVAYFDFLRQRRLASFHSANVVDVRPDHPAGPSLQTHSAADPHACESGNPQSLDSYARTMHRVLRGYLALAGGTLRGHEHGGIRRKAVTRNFGSGRVRTRSLGDDASPTLPLDGDRFLALCDGMFPAWEIRAAIPRRVGSEKHYNKSCMLYEGNDMWMLDLACTLTRTSSGSVETRASWMVQWWTHGDNPQRAKFSDPAAATIMRQSLFHTTPCGTPRSPGITTMSPGSAAFTLHSRPALGYTPTSSTSKGSPLTHSGFGDSTPSSVSVSSHDSRVVSLPEPPCGCGASASGGRMPHGGVRAAVGALPVVKELSSSSHSLSSADSTVKLGGAATMPGRAVSPDHATKHARSHSAPAAVAPPPLPATAAHHPSRTVGGATAGSAASVEGSHDRSRDTGVAAGASQKPRLVVRTLRSQGSMADGGGCGAGISGHVIPNALSDCDNVSVRIDTCRVGVGPARRSALPLATNKVQRLLRKLCAAGGAEDFARSFLAPDLVPTVNEGGDFGGRTSLGH